jgi:hypothetical protein
MVKSPNTGVEFSFLLLFHVTVNTNGVTAVENVEIRDHCR